MGESQHKAVGPSRPHSVCIPALLFHGCVVGSKSAHLSWPQWPHLLNGNDITIPGGAERLRQDDASRCGARPSTRHEADMPSAWVTGTHQGDSADPLGSRFLRPAVKGEKAVISLRHFSALMALAPAWALPWRPATLTPKAKAFGRGQHGFPSHTHPGSILIRAASVFSSVKWGPPASLAELGEDQRENNDDNQGRSLLTCQPGLPALEEAESSQTPRPRAHEATQLPVRKLRPREIQEHACGHTASKGQSHHVNARSPGV